MTKKDYIILAEVLREAVGTCRSVGDDETVTFLRTTVRNLADRLREDNARFDEQKFTNAIFN